MLQAGTTLYNKWRYRHIPGPKPHLLMGTIPDFVKYGGNNIAMPIYKKMYGPVFKVFMLNRAVVVITDPDDASLVLRKFINHPQVAQATLRLLRPDHRRMDDVGLLRARDGTWRALRQAWQPMFSPAPLVAYAQLMDDCALQLCRVLDKLLQQGSGGAAGMLDADGYVDVYDLLSKMTLEVVGSCAYGVTFNELSSVEEATQGDTKAAEKKLGLMEAVKNVFKSGNFRNASKWVTVVAVMPVLTPLTAAIACKFPDARLQETLKCRQLVIDSSQALINDWRAAGKQLSTMGNSHANGNGTSQGRSQVQPGSFLGLLLEAQKRLATQHAGPSPKDGAANGNNNSSSNSNSSVGGGMKMDDMMITAQAMTFIMAGTETTSNTLAFAVYLVCQHPEVEQKLREEVDKHGLDTPITIEDKFPYVDAVVNETLRLYPSAPLTTREVDKPGGIQIGGYHIPYGTNLFISIAALHRDPAVWAKPDEFIPERFLPQGEAELGPRNHNAFIPFGAGPRQCIGYKFAQQEARVALVRLYQRYTFELAPGQVPLKTYTAITLSPQQGVRVRPAPRQR